MIPVVGLLLCSALSSAQHPVVTIQWMNIHGSVYYADGTEAGPGTCIDVYDPDSVICGQSIVSRSGEFGLIAVFGDDPETPVDEGAREGDKLTFKVNGITATLLFSDSVLWSLSTDVLFAVLSGGTSGGTVQVSLGQHSAETDSVVTVPVMLGPLYDSDILSAELLLSFDHTILEYQSVLTENTAAEDWGSPAVHSPQAGQVRIAMAGIFSLQRRGTLVNVAFKVLGTDGNSCDLILDEVVLNEGVPPVFIQNGSFTVGPASPVLRDNMSNPPREFRLMQNHPNPFNAMTHIRYQLPDPCHVTLQIYNTLGQEVAKPVDDWRPSGSYDIRWNAEKQSSGLYFYQIVMKKQNEILFRNRHKLLLLR